MDVTLKGPSPLALTVGILLLARARSFGIPRPRVAVLGDPDDIAVVLGPAILHSHVLASCGVGRELGHGALVVVPGEPNEPLMVCLAREGVGPWFALDTSGRGAHEATRAILALSRDPRPRARVLGRRFRDLLRLLGVPSEAPLLDLLFAAPQPPLTRVALALRTGRGITGESGVPVASFLTAEVDELPDPLPSDLTGAEVLRRWRAGELEGLLTRLRLGARDQVEEWLGEMEALAKEDGGRDLALVAALAELLSHLAMLPTYGMLPPPDAAADAVATGLVRALGASGTGHDANRALADIFRFLGGKFVASDPHPVSLPVAPPPPDRMGRWAWFAAGTAEAAACVDGLWRQIMDKPS